MSALTGPGPLLQLLPALLLGSALGAGLCGLRERLTAPQTGPTWPAFAHYGESGAAPGATGLSAAARPSHCVPANASALTRPLLHSTAAACFAACVRGLCPQASRPALARPLEALPCRPARPGAPDCPPGQARAAFCQPTGWPQDTGICCQGTLYNTQR